MNYRETTQVANVVFDTHLPELKPSEVLVLLVVIRQTVGWYNHRTKKRKYRDWITNKQFQKKTGLSNKAVSNAINALILKNLIEATDSKERILDTPNKRRGNLRTFYRCLLYSSVESTFNPVYRVHITKLTDTKPTNVEARKETVGRLTDRERYHQIVSRDKPP